MDYNFNFYKLQPIIYRLKWIDYIMQIMKNNVVFPGWITKATEHVKQMNKKTKIKYFNWDDKRAGIWLQQQLQILKIFEKIIKKF